MAATLGLLFLFLSLAEIPAQEKGAVEKRLSLRNETQVRQLTGVIEPLQHAGEDCFPSCAKQVGWCTWCGVGNACCKRGANPRTESVPQECLGQRPFANDQVTNQCTTASYRPGEIGPFSATAISSITLAQCTSYMASVGCGWTREESCPNQPQGTHGVSTNDGTIGYRCCCGLSLWKDMNVRPKLTRAKRLECRGYMEKKGCGWTQQFNCPRQAPGSKGQAAFDGGEGYKCCCDYGLWEGGDWSLATAMSGQGFNGEEFGIQVGANGFGGQISTSMNPVSVIQGNTGSIGIGQGAQTGIRGQDNGLEGYRHSERTFLDNHNGGNAVRNTIHYNPGSTYRSDNIGPIENHLSNAKGACIFGICSDLDPDNGPGVESFRSQLVYPSAIGVKRVTVSKAYRYKDLGVTKLIIAEDAPLQETCIVDRYDGDDVWCKEPLQHQHLVGEGTFGKVMKDTAMARLFKLYAPVNAGHCDMPITTNSECQSAAVRLELLDHTPEMDMQISYTNPPYCYYTEGKLYFNPSGGNLGRCSDVDTCICKVDASGYPPVTEFEKRNAGTCDAPVTSKRDCTWAANSLMTELGSAAGTLAYDDLSRSSSNPSGCYWTEGLLKFNSAGNLGACSALDTCLCKKLKSGQVSQARRYKIQRSLKCYTPIKDVQQCSEAASQLLTQLGITSLTDAVDDEYTGVSTAPPWCYVKAGQLKFNANGRNYGSCSQTDPCLCRDLIPGQTLQVATPTQATLAPGTTVAPSTTVAPVAPVAPATTVAPVEPGTTVAPVAPAPLSAPVIGAAAPVAVVAPTVPPPPPQIMNRQVATGWTTPAPLVQSALSAPALTGESEIEVLDQSLFQVGDYVKIGGVEEKKIIGFSSIVLDTPLANTYPANTTVDKIAMPAQYANEYAASIDGLSGSLSSGSSNKLTWVLALVGGFCLLLCCVALISMLGQMGGKKKRSTDRERDLKDRMMSEAELQPMMEEEQPAPQPMTQSNIMTSGQFAMPPVPPPVAPKMQMIPQTTIYQARPQMAMAQTYMPGGSNYLQPGGSMYTGSMYQPVSAVV